MTIRHFAAFLCLALATPALADVVTDLGVLGGYLEEPATWLYYRDDAGVTQGKCASAQGVHDRNTCRGELRTVESNGFITQLLTYGPADLDELAAKVREQLTKVERVDLRLDELLNTPTGDSDVARLEADLRVNQQQQAELETQKSDAEDQARQIRARLAGPSPEPDLARQLAQVEATVLDLARQIEEKAKARNGILVQLIRERSQGSGSDEVQELNRWRAELVVEWEAAQAKYLGAISKASNVRILVRHLTKSQDMFALELLTTNTIFRDLRPYAAVLDSAFEKSATAEGHGVPDNFYAAWSKGDYVGEDDAKVVFSGWDKGYAVYVSRIPDLKQQCFDSVARDDLDHTRFLATPLALPCHYESRGDYYSCYETKEQPSPRGDRILQRQVGVSLYNDGRIDLEVWTTCYEGDGRNTVWLDDVYHVRDGRLSL